MAIDIKATGDTEGFVVTMVTVVTDITVTVVTIVTVITMVTAVIITAIGVTGITKDTVKAITTERKFLGERSSLLYLVELLAVEVYLELLGQFKTANTFC